METIKILRNGTKGDLVKELQKGLNKLLGLKTRLVENGIFDTDTENAVCQFQKQMGLYPDGVVGNATWSSIYFGAHDFTKTVRTGPQ